jgi:hypothetical protein
VKVGAVVVGLGPGGEPASVRSMRFAYPTFRRAADSASWPPPSSEEKIAGA